MGKVKSFLMAFISVAGLAMCFDAIMIHVLTTSFAGDGWYNKSVRVLTAIGRIAFGGFICGHLLFPIIYKYFKGDDK